LFDGFSKQYRCHRLVCFESFDRVENAIQREKQLKRWNREKKVWLIERANPTWEDLSAEWGQADPKAGPSTRQLIGSAAQLVRSG
jgi:putative endonuclease